MTQAHWTDALGDEDPFPPEGCTGGCDHGWRTVGPAYPADAFPGDLAALHAETARLTAEGASEFDIRHARNRADTLALNRAAAASSVFPCPTCRPAMWERWRHGCFTLNHRRNSCRLCTPKQ